MTDISPPVEGLRERRRQRTLARLEEVAIRLFSERGYDAVTVDDIAAEAEVSRRTFFRYFPGKEEVLFADNHRRLDELRAALAARPGEEPALTALRRAIMSMAGDYEHDRDRLLRRAKIMSETPALYARSLASQREGEQAVTDLVAEWLRVDPATNLAPGVVAAATLAAVRVAIYTWLAGGGEEHLPTLVAEALDLLDGGLQSCVPEAGPPPAPRRPAKSSGAPAKTTASRRAASAG